MQPEKKINQLLKENLLRLRFYILKRVGEQDQTEEILQATLIAAAESFSHFQGRSSFFTWLCAIANHEVVDYYRKKKIKGLLFSRFPWLESLASEALGPEQVLMRQELEQKVQQTFARLNEGYRVVLRLKYYQGLSVKEIAKQLNESAKSIESKLTRARRAFAEIYLADRY